MVSLIREERIARSMTQAELATRLGVSKPAVSQWESAEDDGTISLSTLTKALAALGRRPAILAAPVDPLKPIEWDETLCDQIEPDPHGATKTILDARFGNRQATITGECVTLGIRLTVEQFWLVTDRISVTAPLDVAPQATATITLPYASSLPARGELMLNVEYRLVDAEPLLPAGHVVARQQLPIREWDFSATYPTLAARSVDRYTSAGTVAVRDNDRAYLTVEASGFRIDFRRRDGLVSLYRVGGVDMIAPGTVLQPNFWRAPTDNDFGANLQRRAAVWRDPGLRLTSLGHEMADGMAVVTADYDLTATGGTLRIVYTINNIGEMRVRQTLDADDEAQAAADRTTRVPDMLRFGMRMVMPAAFDLSDYYGRGPVENYSDRKDSQFIGLWHQTADEQFWAYDRPQETGTHSDLRWWRQSDLDGRGLRFVSTAAFSASALHYSQEQLDEGLAKRNMHPGDLERDERVWLCIDGAQAGLGCINSWGALPQPEHRLPYADREFEFTITPGTQLR